MVEIDLVRIPLPGLGISSVNLYLVDKRVLVDAGYYHIVSLHEIVKRLRELGTRLEDLEAVVITHFHVDHMSLAGLLGDITDAKIYVGHRDLELVRRGADRFVSRVLDIYREFGVPEEEVSNMFSSHPVTRLAKIYTEDLARRDMTPVREGDRVSGVLEVLETPGHTPGSISLRIPDTDIVFTGDALLPTITPHVIYHEYSEDPLGEHLRSLERLALSGLRTAYPGHGEVVGDLVARSREIIGFHEKRLGEIIEVLRTSDSTLYDVAKRIRWRVRYSSWDEFPYHERFFAVGEALAHLIHLSRRGLVDYYEKNNTRYWYLVGR